MFTSVQGHALIWQATIIALSVVVALNSQQQSLEPSAGYNALPSVRLHLMFTIPEYISCQRKKD